MTASLDADHYCAELLGLKGEGLLTSFVSQQTEAEQNFLDSLSLVPQQQAKAWELRAAVCLGRLCQHQRKIAQTRQLVADAYQWFTEGFDTADLRQTQALLEYGRQ